MTNEDKRMIPLPVIDALISQLRDYSNFLHQYDIGQETLKAQVQLIDLVVIPNLEAIKKEAISNPHEKIRAEITDAWLNEPEPLSSLTCPFCKDTEENMLQLAAHLFEHSQEQVYGRLALMTYQQSRTKPLEQRIRDRIKELENMWFTGPNVMKDIEYRDVKIDELRKLLSPK